MKKFRYVLAVMLTVMLSATMVSCGSDKDEPEGDDLIEQLQGTWRFSVMEVTTMGQTITLTESELDKFAGDQGYSGYFDKVLDFDGNKVNGTSYSVRGNMINIPAYYGDQWGEVIIKGSSMHIVYEVVEQGIEMTIDISYKRAGKSYLPAATRDGATSILSAAKSR